MIRILIVVTRGDTIGGAQKHILVLADELLKQDYEVLVIFGSNTSDLFRNQLIERNIPYKVLKYLNNQIISFFDLIALLELSFIIRKFNPKIVSLHSTKSGMLFRFLSPFFRARFILTVHGWAFADGVPKIRRVLAIFLEKMFTHLVDHFILVSYYDWNLAKRFKIVTPSKMTVIHNFLENIHTQNSTVNLPANAFRIVMVARFDKQKDQQTLIKACSDLNFVDLTFVGSGPMFNDVVQFSKTMNCKCKVVFLGNRLDIDDILLQNDLFVLCSHWEGFPLSTIEAMRCGLPVVVTNAGGSAECIVQGENGFVIDKGDWQSLKFHIESLWEDRARLNYMSKQSKLLFHRNYSSDKKLKELIPLYLKLSDCIS